MNFSGGSSSVKKVSSYKSYSYSSSSSNSNAGGVAPEPSYGRGGYGGAPPNFGRPGYGGVGSGSSSHSSSRSYSSSGSNKAPYNSNLGQNQGAHGMYSHVPLAPLASSKKISSTSYGSGSGSQQLSSAELNKYASLEMQSGSKESSKSRKMCTKKPMNVMNAKVKCSLIDNKCVAKCVDGYQFPTGEPSMEIICQDGVWTLKKSEWNDNLSCERKLISINLIYFFLSPIIITTLA